MKRVLTSWWFVSIAVALIVVLLLCLGLPLFAAFLRPIWVRLTCLLVVVLIWGALAFRRVRRARRSADAIAAELNQGDAESGQLASRMAEALATLRTATGGKRRDYLYSRPWYVIIGPPGAGKTTALIHSGLRFPFGNDALKGVGGTRNLDFLFADEAVLVDTAGRYTSQDSDAAADAKGWQGFLGLLKKHRPLQPINGVIVAIGVDELLRGDRQSIDQHAANVRRRLGELRKTLEIETPVYLLLTKGDLLPGFVEYFEDLDVEGRRAVLGHTLPFSTARPSLDRLADAFDETARSIEARQAARLSNESDQQRRALILGFPAQLNGLRARLLRFTEGAFIAGDVPVGNLRGFYLASGVQEGAPLDRLLSGMVDLYDQPRPAASGSGRAYFLNRLLTEVIFNEAGLGALNPAARKRHKFQLTAAIAGIALVSLLILVAWGVSFTGNRGFQANLLSQAQAAAKDQQAAGLDMVEVRDSDAGLDQALDYLRRMRNLPNGYAEAKAGVPLSMRFGLFQSGLAGQAQEAYRESLRRVLLPRILLQIEKALRADMANPLAAFAPLKVYLMLGGRCPYGIDAGAVKGWVKGYWATVAFPGADAADVRKQLGEHLDALLEDPDLAVSWPGRQAPIDGQLVATAQAAVQGLPMAERAYVILKQKAAGSGGAPWAAGNYLASGDGIAFANGDAVLGAQIPYFFTREGYEKVFQPGLATVQADLKRDLWVFGADAGKATIQGQLGQVKGGVAALYAREYTGAWDGLLALLQPADYFGNPQALAAVTRAAGPLKTLLLQVRANTKFDGGTRAAGDMAKAKITSRLGSAASLAPTATGNIDAGREIEGHFKPLHDYVGDGNVPAPLDAFLTALANASQAITAAKMGGAALTDGGQAMNTAQAAVAAAAAGAPPQLQSFTGRITQGGGAKRVEAATGAVSEAYVQSVLPVCKAAVDDRYPFFAGATQDMQVADAQRVFGLGQVIDGFVTQRLATILLTSGPIWRWKTDDPVAAALDPASPDSFSQAAQIRNLITGGLTITVEPVSFSGGADAAQITSGDTNFTFTASTPGSKQVHWSAQGGGAPTASVTLMKGGQQMGPPIQESGVWALFRLMERAKRQNSGQSLLASFSTDGGSVTLRVTLPSEDSPFGRGGMWAFRCPLKL